MWLNDLWWLTLLCAPITVLYVVHSLTHSLSAFTLCVTLCKAKFYFSYNFSHRSISIIVLVRLYSCIRVFYLPHNKVTLIQTMYFDIVWGRNEKGKKQHHIKSLNVRTKYLNTLTKETKNFEWKMEIQCGGKRKTRRIFFNIWWNDHLNVTVVYV